jgi:hypothetical protein
VNVNIAYSDLRATGGLISVAVLRKGDQALAPLIYTKRPERGKDEAQDCSAAGVAFVGNEDG